MCVLEDVDPRVLDRGVVERWPVPEIDPADEQQDRDERMTQDVNDGPHRPVPRERPHHASAHHVGQTEEHRAYGLTDEDERRRDHREEHVLQHVDAEEIDREDLERWYQRGEERRDPEEEDARAPRRPAPPLHPPHATRVGRRGENGDDDG